ncbi:MAG: hypothetical protein IPK59_04040 [Rhodospirillaceae bacterium]|nr:hypothetical protein [Rhodospirillaceae bacterium]
MKTPTNVIVAAQDLAGKAPARIQLLPKEAVTGAAWRGQDGRGPYSVGDIAKMIAASQLPLSIDYDHLSDLPQGAGVEKPAAGWITKLESDADGLWGEVEWTSRASASIADKEYRFISPAFAVLKDSGEILRLTGAGLVNKPNFVMQALASQSGGLPTDPPAKEKEATMNASQSAALCAALAIATDSDASAIVTAAQNLRVQLDTLGKTLDLSGKTSVEIATAAVGALARLDTAAFVPKADHDKVVTDLASLQTKVKEADAIAAVETQMRAGKVTPAQKDYWTAEAKRDLAAFNKWAESAPVVVDPGTVQATLAAAGEGKDKIAVGIPTQPGTTMDPERIALHNKVRAHMAKNPNVSYEAALRVVA